MLSERYVEAIRHIVNEIYLTQCEGILEAAAEFARAISTGHWVFVFGTGHSHMMAEELFYRAGGLACIVPILETGLMLHEGAIKSTALERCEGYGRIVIEDAGVSAGDVLVIASNSGINAVPVEAAIAAKEAGALVIALTSIAHSSGSEPRNAAGKRLYEVADLALDNCGRKGDAVLELEGLGQKFCPTSTIAGCLILHCVVAETIDRLVKQGFEVPVLSSANLPGSDEKNEQLLRPLRKITRHM